MNKRLIQSPIVVLSLLLFVQTSCISNKKHLAAIQSANDAFELQREQYATQIKQQKLQTDSLRIALATAEGGRTTLLESQMQFQEKIDALQDQLRNSQSSAQSTTQGLNQTLAQKDEQIQAKQEIIAQQNAQLQANQEEILENRRQLQARVQTFENELQSSQENCAALTQAIEQQHKEISELKQSGQEEGKHSLNII